MRKLLIALAILAGIIFLLTRQAELESMVQTFQAGNWLYLLIAFIVQLGWMVVIAGLFKSVLSSMNVDLKISRLIIMVAAANFVNVVTPSAGMGGMAIFISEAKKHNHSIGKATIAGALFILFDYLGFASILAVSLFVLLRRNNLNTPELIASTIFLIITLILAFLLYLGMQSATLLGNALAWISRVINKVIYPFIRRDYLSVERAYDFADEAADGLKQIMENPKRLILPLFLAITNKGLLIIVLSLVFLAFNVPASIGTLIVGFAISFLFLIVSPTPSGIGFVEGALTLFLASSFIPISEAAVIAIAYRGFTFWIPFFSGMIAFRWLDDSKKLPT